MKENLFGLLNEEVWPGAAVLWSATKGMDAADIAEVFEQLDTAKAVRFFRLLPKNVASEVFAYIVKEKKYEIIKTLTDKEQASLINELFADDAADLVEEMPANVVTKLLQNASTETRQNINALLKYPEDSAGSIMTVEYVRLKPDQQVSNVFDVIRQYGVDKETIYTCYVVDDKRTLVGVVSVKDLLLASPAAKISEIMKTDPIYAHTHDSREAVADIFRKYGYLSLPIADSERKLVGIVTVDDVLQVIDEEHTKDLSIMSAVSPSDNTYLATGVMRHSRNRIVWLLLLMVSAMVTGFIISGFEKALLTVPVLMVFVPMLMGTGGNAGSQASTQIIRGMALGEITDGQVMKVWWKEIRVALMCSLALGLVNFIRVVLLEGLIESGGISIEIVKIAAVVTLALCCTIVMAKSLGCLLPMFARKCRLDPALMAAPLIASILDALSLLVYFGFATLLLGL